jgi:tetratricopeptide (TPR) repeat protein
MREVAGALRDAPIDERFGRGSLMPSVAWRAWLALCLGHTGEFPEAIAWGGHALRIAETSAGPQERIWAAYCLARVHLERGDAQLALPLLEQAVPLCSEGRYPIYWPRVLASLGAAYTMSARPEAALRVLGQAAAESEATKMVYGRQETVIHTGAAHLAAGRLDDAKRFAEDGLALARRVGARGDEARALHLLGEIAGQRERLEGAEALERHAAALSLAEEIGMAPLAARCHLGLGAVHQRSGQGEEARGELAYAAAMLRSMQMQHWLGLAELVSIA